MFHIALLLDSFKRANFTGKNPGQLRMFSSQMIFISTALNGRIRAMRTLIRPDPSVSHNMPPQRIMIPRLKRAFVTIKRFIPGVLPQVHLEHSFPSAGMPADRANIRPEFRMNRLYVILQALGIRISLPAHLASFRSVPPGSVSRLAVHVHDPVVPELAGLLETFSALRTLVIFVLAVDSHVRQQLDTRDALVAFADTAAEQINVNIVLLPQVHAARSPLGEHQIRANVAFKNICILRIDMTEHVLEHKLLAAELMNTSSVITLKITLLNL